jgi:hypothetical protein
VQTVQQKCVGSGTEASAGDKQLRERYHAPFVAGSLGRHPSRSTSPVRLVVVEATELSSPPSSPYKKTGNPSKATSATFSVVNTCSLAVARKNSYHARFSDSFLVVTPGITIRDRLRVLYPNDPGNYYRERDLVPADLMATLPRANIVITNFHSFSLRERTQASRLTKKLSGQDETGVSRESPDQMVRRVCRELGNKRNVIVLNDEAHHCYRHKPDGEHVALVGDERKEAEKREEEARLWINGLESVQKKTGVRAAYDLSATPFFLRGSGYDEGTLFGWVVSDFSLIDALCGTSWPGWLPVLLFGRHVHLAFNDDDAGGSMADEMGRVLTSIAVQWQRLRPEGCKDWNQALLAGKAIGHHDESRQAAANSAPAKPALTPMPAATDEYQQRIRAQMEQELSQQRARLQQHRGE